MTKQFYPCGLRQYQLMIVGTHLQPKMIWSPLITKWRVCRLFQSPSSHIVICGTAAKIQLPVRKILLLGRSDFEMLLTNGP